MNSLTLHEIKELKKDLAKEFTAKIKEFNRITGVNIKKIIPEYQNLYSDEGMREVFLNKCYIEVEYE